MSKSLLSFFRLTNVTKPKVPGYFVASTAPLNIEGKPANQQEADVEPEATTTEAAERTLQQIAELVYHKITQTSQSEAVELVISVHGFSNSRKAAHQRCEQIHEYINTDDSPLIQAKAKNLIYVGYRWPSEPLFGDNFITSQISNAFKALPILPRYILAFTLGMIIVSLLPSVQQSLLNYPLYFLFCVAFLFIAFLFFSLVTVILLRVLNYFRDKYRATHFGIPDLVEFLRQLDKLLTAQVKKKFIHKLKLTTKLKELLIKAVKQKIKPDVDVREKHETIESVCERVVEVFCEENTVNTTNLKEIEAEAASNYPVNPEQLKKIIVTAIEIITQDTDTELAHVRNRTVHILVQKAIGFWSNRKRVKLTFIGHSMGGYVITSAVRTLCDVFDLSSIGTLGLTSKIPTPDIGCTFQLSRLVLIAPDIPINTIISGRANFLSSSLRRFRETYLFCNETDLALRLASTIANYFIFPARTRESGYRLGNVAIKDSLGYGIINRDEINTPHSEFKVLDKLFVDSFDIEDSLELIRAKYNLDKTESSEQVAKLFTFFDCTDYFDQTIKGNSAPKLVLNVKKWKIESDVLNFPGLRHLRELLYYIRLTFAYTFRYKDTHGGYFDGEFIRHVMYRLAFLRFGGLLDSLTPEDQQELADIQQQIAQCKQEYLNRCRKNTDNNVGKKEQVKQQLEQLRERKQEIRLAGLGVLNRECKHKKIQVLLSPEQYDVEILGRDRPQVRREILNAQPIPAAILHEC